MLRSSRNYCHSSYSMESCNNTTSSCAYRIDRQCLICGRPAARPFMIVETKSYWRCRACQATFLDPAHRISTEEEYALYCQHRNEPDDPRYCHFLSKLAEPLLQRLPPKAKGLDYGCGPGPALASMLRQAGHRVSLFDVYFYPDRKPLGELFDFITCSETIEHFHHPAKEFRCFDRVLRPGGWLALMTCFQTDDSRFASWHYRRDLTHVVFYREDTLRHLACDFGWSFEVPVKNVALMRKP